MEQDYNTILLSTAYFAPVQYFTKFLLSGKIIIEVHETFPKQTYRNRCVIYGANGKQSLVIPVKKINGNRTKTADILIDYNTDWRKNHVRAIESAYKHSPFFEFYEDIIMPFYKIQEKRLVEFNMKLLNTLLQLLEIKVTVIMSERYFKTSNSFNDYRVSIHPKKQKQESDPYFIQKNYIQVFSDKHGFKENLSIIDLLFNEGPNARNILMHSIKEG